MKQARNSVPREALALVSTTKFLLLVDLNSGEVTPIEDHRTEYYGISWAPGGEDLILSHSVIDNMSFTDPTSYMKSEQGFISIGKRQSQGFLSQPHQILSASDGRVVCTNTGRNSICVLNLDRPSLMTEARISPARWDRISSSEAEGDHLNSVFEKDAKLYVLAHGHTKGSSLATFTFPELDLISVEPIKGRAGMHNIWVTDEGQHIGCDSNEGAIIDIIQNVHLWKGGDDIYVRGLAASSDFILVGESQKVGRDLRAASHSGLWIIDRKTWKPLDYISLGPYGAIHEVRLANLTDEAHHGHVFAGLDSLKRRDLRATLAKQKLDASSRADQFNRLWDEFELIFGHPKLDDHGGRIAPSESLCLQIMKPSQAASEGDLTFRYALNAPSGPSHVSIVSTCGDRADTNMRALTIQRVDDTRAMLNCWVTDDAPWRLLDIPEIAPLPTTATVTFRRTPVGSELLIDANVVLRLPTEIFPTERRCVGVRWIGATIYSS